MMVLGCWGLQVGVLVEAPELGGTGLRGPSNAPSLHSGDSFPEWSGRLGAAASTANLLDDVEGHACGEAGRGSLNASLLVTWNL